MADMETDQSGQTVEGDQVNIGDDAKIEHVGDIVGGDKVAGNKIDTSGGDYIAGDVYYYPPPDPEKPHLRYEPETVFVASGPFLMGSLRGEGVPEEEMPQHELMLPAFRIGRFPVTQAQYEHFLSANKDQPVPWGAGWFHRKPSEDKQDHPVTRVNWKDAMDYCAWLSKETGRRYCLPSEAQWEKAASWSPEESENQAPHKRLYTWGDEWHDNCCNVGSEGTTSVYDHPEGASVYGAEGMLGNVEEWTSSMWGCTTKQPEFGYPYDAQDGREAHSGEDLPARMRVIHRGRSYKSEREGLSSTGRCHAAPNSRIDWRGFRVAMALE